VWRRWCILLAAPAWAHVVSMSTGELTVDGPTAVYELRMPMYEVAHMANPESLMDHIRFDDAHRTSAKCHEDDGTYVCIANYEFSGLIDRLDVECTFYQVTVPNHVHLLHAAQGANSDQAVFDQSFPRAQIRFHPPSRFELAARDLAAGAWRGLASPAGLFLLVVILAARSGREAALLTAMYVAGEWIMRPIGPAIPWPLAPKFLEAAMALSVAYFALEILILPEAGKRWAIVLALGLFHGLLFASFPAAYLAGATAVLAMLVALFAWVALRWATPLVRRVGAGVLLAAGLGWFAVRVIRP
jgi:hypothetical protein